MRRAVVSTSVGCEGLAAEDGIHLLVADDGKEFAARIIELLDDPARRRALGHAGRQLVEEQYDWSTLGARLNAILLRCFESDRSGDHE
jgi:glycosyltransferase involved in cell wall biosynthesis